jgi:glycosyltransferase involved in cell wall biosynthesis
MNKKLKILVVPSDKTGVSYYRSTIPHIKLEEYYPDLFHVDIDYNANLDNDKFLKQYDLIHFHRTLGDYEKMESILNKMDELGIVTIMDIDDHWSPGPDHPAWNIIKENKINVKIANNLKMARNVTTTTEVFAEEIRKLNKNANVFVIPNAINTEEKQYQPNPVKSDRIRIGWLGGSSHLKDLQILRGVAQRFKNDGLLDKIQFVLCGYDLRGKVTTIDPKTKQQIERKIKPKESVWYQYEKIFTDDYNIVSDDYKKWLLKFEEEEYPNVDNEPYRRVWTKHITSYAENYNLFDISLAPLKHSTFNKVKSQLKVIEAGFHKKALIAQDFGPYQIDVNNIYVKGEGYQFENNAILVPENKNHKFWYKHLKHLVLNPELISQMGENLYNTVNGEYDMKSVCDKRKELYSNLVKEKQESLVENVG